MKENTSEIDEIFIANLSKLENYTTSKIYRKNTSFNSISNYDDTHFLATGKLLTKSKEGREKVYSILKITYWFRALYVVIGQSLGIALILWIWHQSYSNSTIRCETHDRDYETHDCASLRWMPHTDACSPTITNYALHITHWFLFPRRFWIFRHFYHLY